MYFDFLIFILKILFWCL